MIKVLICLVVLLVLIIGIGIFMWPHFWLKENKASVSINGNALETVNLYQSPKGDLLVRYLVEGGYEDYVIRKPTKEVGLPNSGNFLLFPFCVYSKELDPPLIMSTNRIKVERDLSVNFTVDFVELTTSDDKRIRITF